MQKMTSGDKPTIAITMGDAAGIGPEIAVKAWSNPELHAVCRPFVIGSPVLLRRVAAAGAAGIEVVEMPDSAVPPAAGSILDAAGLSPSVHRLVCLSGSSMAVERLTPAMVHPEAARAAVDYLHCAIDLATSRRVDALVTLPLNKEGLHRAGLAYPGHTEILAERTNSKRFGMMLYRQGLGVVHVTLHLALRDVFVQLTTAAVHEKILLLDDFLRRLDGRPPRLAVAALNPHAGDGGIFGDEEARLIAPAVAHARAGGCDVAGPFPADTLFVRAHQGNFDGVVAMYHDQGHIALKLLGWKETVNVTVGLPIIRTSVAHGTAYDIVGKNQADPASLLEAVRVAVRLVRSA